MVIESTVEKRQAVEAKQIQNAKNAKLKASSLYSEAEQNKVPET